MPELPEVETVKRGLENALAGATISEVILRRGNLRTPFADNFADVLEGRKIIKISRRAKYLLFYFDSDDILIAHLGMTGRFSVVAKNKVPEYETHDHVVFILKDGRQVIYNDPRRFGLMELTTKKSIKNHKLLKDLAPEPLEEAFTTAYLKNILSKRATPIKPNIMDQKLVVGVGNIYANEALFLSGISPLTPANQVKKIPLLIKNIHKVLNDAIAAGGSTLNDFEHVNGDSGYFQHDFHVYGREGKPCTSCKNPIISIRQAGRASFYCGKCQR